MIWPCSRSQRSNTIHSARKCRLCRHMYANISSDWGAILEISEFLRWLTSDRIEAMESGAGRPSSRTFPQGSVDDRKPQTASATTRTHDTSLETNVQPQAGIYTLLCTTFMAQESYQHGQCKRCKSPSAPQCQEIAIQPSWEHIRRIFEVTAISGATFIPSDLL